VIQVGDTFGGYEILSKLSSGGMATLYLARRDGASGFSKHVAVKVVHEHLAEDPTFVEMFVDEALLSSRIHHPNVVHIEELRELDGQHFLVMEYVSGVSLHQLMGRLARLGRRMTPDLAVYVAVQVADGLHAAHELTDANGRLEGLVHRDVSPQNVLLAWEGYVKLIDFGVAKARSRIQQTTSASLKGKLRYMAPEQAGGVEVDRRTDVYALGIVLWEMLCMRPRFRAANDFVLLDQVRAPEHVSVRPYNPDVSPGLDAVLKKALAPAPRDRFGTAQEFRQALAIAAPRALALDSSHVSELVRAACADELDRARDRLPHSMVLPGERAVAEDPDAVSLHTLTVSASQVLEVADLASASRVTAATVSHSSSRPAADPPAVGPDSRASGSFAHPARASAGLGARVTAAILFSLLIGVSVYILFPPGATDSSGRSEPVAPAPAAPRVSPSVDAARPTEAIHSAPSVSPDAGTRSAPPSALAPIQDVPSQALDRLHRPVKRRGRTRRRRVRPRRRKLIPLRK